LDSETILRHLQQVLRDLHAESARHGPELGSPPASLIVEQRTPSQHAQFNTGTTMKRWRVSVDGTAALAPEDPLPAQTRSGMYYDSGRADFSVHEQLGKVRVGWQVGPRYGRGYDLPIERSPDGALRLGVPSPLWVS